MTQNELKKYSVIVGNGSGCFFQPMTREYTYILTAKHLFFDNEESEQGQRVKVPKADGTQIRITKQIQAGDTWKEEVIPFVIAYGQNYFPHQNADIAILKINYESSFDDITIQDFYENETDFALCGFPINYRVNNPGERYRNNIIERFGASGNYSTSAQLSQNLAQHDIEGMSGGGILKLNQEGISIMGIQSKMANEIYPASMIGIVPLRFAQEIIDYEANAGHLEKLMPSTLSNFSFLKDNAFLLEVDAIDMKNAEAARVTLINKAQNIIESNITPYGIRELFKERLLISESDRTCLSFRSVWIAWLEFLTIMNIMKYEAIDNDNLSIIFNAYRLKYVNLDDWTDTDIQKEYGKSDYLGMPAGSTVVVSSRKGPKTNFIFPKGKLIDIIRPYDKTGFRTDKGIDPFTSFDFVHLDYFKTKCIIQKIKEFNNLSEEEIINKLKQEYNELFN